MSRYSVADMPQHVVQARTVGSIRRSTVWRILDRDARKPWRQRLGIFPPDPDVARKAGRVLDRQAGWWEGQPLGPGDYVLSADEKTSIQVRCRCHPTRPPRPTQAGQVEFEYEGVGAVQYLAAWDVQRGVVCGRGEAHTGIAPCGRLVAQVMTQEPQRSAPRVCWIVASGSSHRGHAASTRLTTAYPNLTLVHLPVHASWLNQIAIYFSIRQRKVLTPNDFAHCAAVAQRLLAVERRMNAHPHPFTWKSTRADLDRWLHERASPLVPLRDAA